MKSLSFCLILCGLLTVAYMKCGGTSDAKPANDEIRAIVTQVKGAVEDHAKKSYSVFEPHSYTTQVVAGTNYFVKVKVADDGEHVHLRVHKSLPHAGGELSLHSIQHSKTEACPIEHF
ncbi:cystatin-B-like isoform X2 [Bolinopsis microptera]|uniref:cystatin-B-like isoform X2 n=1 Tax=Bolinopsis microptera TaxID=2820187 RepID=UPI00307A0D76